MVEQLLEYALDVSISEERFWKMTIPEVNREIKAWGWREERQRQYFSSLAYRIPTLIAIAVLEGKKYPELYEAFPNEFDEKKIKEARHKLQVEKDIATFKAWAEHFNSKKGE